MPGLQMPGLQITMSNKFKSTSHSVIIALIVTENVNLFIERLRINLETYIRFPNKKRIIIRNLKLIQLPNLSLNGVSLAIGMILSLILISCGRSTVIPSVMIIIYKYKKYINAAKQGLKYCSQLPVSKENTDAFLVLPDECILFTP